MEIKIDNSLRTKCEIWSRPCGYLRPKSLYNNGKKQEVEERKKFKVTQDELDNSREIK